MMEIKKTIKYDGKLKDLRVIEGNVVNDSGEILNLSALFAEAYGEEFFTLSVSSKSEDTYIVEGIANDREIEDDDDEDEDDEYSEFE